jgi:hypothetical protein
LEGRFEAPLGSTRIVLWNDQPTVLSTLMHELATVGQGPPTHVTWVKKPWPLVDAAGAFLAVEGIDKVTVLDGTAATRRNVIGPLGALAADPYGKAITSRDDVIEVMK